MAPGLRSGAKSQAASTYPAEAVELTTGGAGAVISLHTQRLARQVSG